MLFEEQKSKICRYKQSHDLHPQEKKNITLTHIKKEGTGEKAGDIQLMNKQKTKPLKNAS